MILATHRTSPETKLLNQIIINPKIRENLDFASYHALSVNKSTHLQFFQVVAQGLLQKIPTPLGIQINLDVDGEEKLDEIHLHIECTDISPLLIIELDLNGLNATNLLDQNGVKHFYGLVAKAIQTAIQNDRMVKADPGKMNSRLSAEDKKNILNDISESLLQK